MPITLQHEGDNIFRIGIQGMLRQSEMQQCQKQLLDEMHRLGTVRLLFVLDDFKGSGRRRTTGSDLSFYIQHGDAIERIAIVGEERWRDHSLMFAAADTAESPRRVRSCEALSPRHGRGWQKTPNREAELFAAVLAIADAPSRVATVFRISRAQGKRKAKVNHVVERDVRVGG